MTKKFIEVSPLGRGSQFYGLELLIQPTTLLQAKQASVQKWKKIVRHYKKFGSIDYLMTGTGATCGLCRWFWYLDGIQNGCDDCPIIKKCDDDKETNPLSNHDA